MLPEQACRVRGAAGTQLENEPKPSKSVVGGMRLTGAQGCPWGVWIAVSTGADLAGPGIFIADTVLPLRFPRLSIARPFDMLRSRIG